MMDAQHIVRRRERGISLIVALVMLIAVLMLGISATHIALQAEKSARNDRDRQIAFQAAEAALIDAEMDIEQSPDAALSRSVLFSPNKTEGFAETCGSGVYLGLCLPAPDGTTPVWQTIDLADDASSNARSVSYGNFTGQTFQSGNGSLPAKPPRYIIELMRYNKAGESADQPSYFYRITAIGFGVRDATQVVLQTFYRKEQK